ncbi:MAG: Rpn family recombination-promoting nuclease/putative transposase [Victivallales bacterium]|nr:Rpn family recombination-promoting nuclease/putative transposase [Victivallales bacterium]
MRLKDIATKNFFGRADVLVSILDYVLYEGKQTVQLGQLHSLNGEHPMLLQNPDGSFRATSCYRDKLFEYDNEDGTISIGVEFQSYNDWSMVLRMMGYDLPHYWELFKEGRMHPIVNLVLSFDRRRSHPPNTLEQMFKKVSSVAAEHFFNYGFTSLNIYDIAENYDSFSCEELQKVLYLFKCDREERPFTEAFDNEKFTGTMSRDAAIVCAIFLNLDLKIEDDSKEIDMCKAVSDMKKRCREEGREEGIKLGAENTLRGIVERLRNMNLSVHEICHLLGVSEETLHQIELSL